MKVTISVILSVLKQQSRQQQSLFHLEDAVDTHCPYQLHPWTFYVFSKLLSDLQQMVRPL